MEKQVFRFEERLMGKVVSSVEGNIKELYQGNGRLYLLCLLVGAITGIFVSLYRHALHVVGALRESFISRATFTDPKFLLGLWLSFVAIGFLADLIYRKYPRISGSGIPQVKGIIMGTVKYTRWFQELIAKFVDGFLVVGVGLSLGREGPSVQMGSYIAKGVARRFRCDRIKENYLITSGASAGIAGAFGAPLAGVMFSLEEIHKFLTGKLIVCIFLASIASDFVGRRFFGTRTAFDVLVNYPTEINPYFQFLLYVLFGVVVAFFGKMFTVLLLKTQDMFNTKKLPRWSKIIFVMTLSFILCFILPEVTGGGHDLVESLPHLHVSLGILVLIFVVKLLFTAISYATGFAGGIFLPMLVLGAILGKIFALVLAMFYPLEGNIIMHFMVLGMVAYFVSVVRAPITGVVLILEMTGNFDHLLAFVTVSVVSFYVTGLLKLAPIYEILYDRMPKDDLEEKHEIESMGKTIITVPIATESYLDGKKISEVDWGNEVLVISLQRNEKERIPKGDMRMQSGDFIILLLPESKVSEVKEDMLAKGME